MPRNIRGLRGLGGITGLLLASGLAFGQEIGPNSLSPTGSNFVLPAARDNLGLGTANAVVFQQLSLGSPSINHTGALSASTTGLFGQPLFFGSSNAANDSYLYFGISDAVNYYGSNALSGLNVTLSPGAIAGNRNAIFGQVGIASPASPGDPSLQNYVGLWGSAFATVNNGGVPGTISPSSYKGGIWGGLSFPRLTTAATAWQSIVSHEFDDLIDASSSAAANGGIAIVHSIGHRTRGTYIDNAIGIADQPDAGMATWLTGISIGDELDQFPLGSDSTILRVQPKLYNALGTAPFSYGVDFRRGAITAGGAAFASPNFQVDPAGVTYVNGLTTSGTVAAKSATMTSVVVNDGGVYLTVPTFTVQAPPSGSTATTTVATMGGASIVGFGSTGRGYTANDITTYVGGTGTSPTFKFGTVNGSGAATACTIQTAGALSVAAANPIAPTGGTGTGALLNVTYADVAGVYTAAGCTFAATGSGFLVNDVIAPAGDTGTEPTFTVSAITADGGITATTLTSAGSLTALAGTTYRTATGGAGVNASIKVGYAVVTLTTTPGSGYLPLPLPVITPAVVTPYRRANLLAVMTTANAPMTLTGTMVTTAPITGVNTNVPLAATSAVEFSTGRDLNGALPANELTADLAFQYGGAGGGFRHIITTKHNNSNTGNSFNFWLNTNATPSVSSTPGTGNALAFTIANTGTTTVGSSAISGAITAPGLATSSAATTGTLCWTTGTGNVNVDTTLACLSSDERLKNISGLVTGALGEILALRPIAYRWKDGTPKATDDPGEHVGLGAFATGYVDERLIARDGEGNPHGWRQDAVVAATVGAVQELDAKVDRQQVYIWLLAGWCLVLTIGVGGLAMRGRAAVVTD